MNYAGHQTLHLSLNFCLVQWLPFLDRFFLLGIWSIFLLLWNARQTKLYRKFYLSLIHVTLWDLSMTDLDPRVMMRYLLKVEVVSWKEFDFRFSISLVYTNIHAYVHMYLPVWSLWGVYNVLYVTLRTVVTNNWIKN